MIAISETITPLIVTVDASTVRCSAIDYMAPEVKINIPQLKGITLFDHENREQLFANINGHDFEHTRSGQLTQRSYEDCLLF